MGNWLRSADFTQYLSSSCIEKQLKRDSPAKLNISPLSFPLRDTVQIVKVVFLTSVSRKLTFALPAYYFGDIFREKSIQQMKRTYQKAEGRLLQVEKTVKCKGLELEKKMC